MPIIRTTSALALRGPGVRFLQRQRWIFNMRSFACAAGVVMFFVGSAVAQTTPRQQEADSLFQAQAWAQAAKAYERLVKEDPEAANAPTMFRLGYAYHSQEQYAKAVEAWKKAEELGFPAQNVRYNIAVAYAQDQHMDEAFAWLHKAVESGFNNLGVLENDADLANLRADARFEQLLAQATENHPCNRPGCRLFDFWVGEWDVFNPAGVKVGTNSIKRILNSCALHESWTSARGGSGQSLNYFHPRRKKWVQLWVDGSGGVIEMDGEFRDGAMHLEGRNIQQDGSFELIRGTWAPLEDGRVRQFFEQSKDKGKSWYTWFDGYYTSR